MRKCEFAFYLWSEIEVNLLVFLTARLLSAPVPVLLLKGCFHLFVL